MKTTTKKSIAAALMLGGVSGLAGLALFGDNIKGLMGMSSDALAGDSVVVKRTYSKAALEKKKLTNFQQDYSDYGGSAQPAYQTPAVQPNQVVRTLEDSRSTFAIDVDTASYTNARRAVLQSNVLPTADSVRVEEWVNSFHYTALEQPEERNAPFAITVDGARSPFDETKTLLRVALQGRVVKEKDRKPANLVFLFDTSCSMSGADRIDLAKRSMGELVANLTPSDTVSVVTYAGSTQVVLPPTPASAKEKILNAIERLETGGGTAMGSGMELAYQLAVRQVRRGTSTRVIVLTDGDANIGQNQTPDQILAAVHGHVEEGVTLTTVGFGTGNYRDGALERLADRGNGQALYVDSASAIDKVFRKNLTGTLEVIAKDTKVQVSFDSRVVKSYRLVGYENRAVADEDFTNDRVDAGELGAGHQVTALYEVVLTGEQGALGVVAVRGELPDSREIFQTEVRIPRAAVSNQLKDMNHDFRFATSVALAADSARGNVNARWPLSAIADLAEGATNGDPEREEFVKIARRMQGIREGSVAQYGNYGNAGY